MEKLQTQTRGRGQFVGELYTGQTGRLVAGFLCPSTDYHFLVDVLRRAFYRWLTVKRAAEHRRLTHQRKEAQLRQILITSAWDRWREKFKEEKLRPLVRLSLRKHVSKLTTWG